MAVNRETEQVVVMDSTELMLYRSMLDAIPYSEDDGFSAIMSQIANAASPEDLDSAFNADGLRDWVNKEIVIEDVKKADSDFQGDLGVFLILDFYDKESGEKVTATTGAQSIMCQVMMAYVKGWLPLNCIVRQKDKPTKKGFYPMHLQTSKF